METKPRLQSTAVNHIKFGALLGSCTFTFTDFETYHVFICISGHAQNDHVYAAMWSITIEEQTKFV